MPNPPPDLTLKESRLANRDSALADHEPVQITGKRGNAVLVAEDDWRAIQETLHLVSIRGMRDSILAGMADGKSSCELRPGIHQSGEEGREGDLKDRIAPHQHPAPSGLSGA